MRGASGLDFLRSLYAPYQGVEAEIATPESGPVLLCEVRCFAPLTGKPGPRDWFAISERGLGKAAEFAACHGVDYDAYMGVLPRVGRGGETKHVHYCGVLWMDVDAGDQTYTEARELLLIRCRALGLPVPGLIVRSGGGLHVYWLLAQPVPCRTMEEQAAVKRVLARLVRGVGGDLDHAHACPKAIDVPRILRVPGTMNLKRLDTPRPVVCIRCEAGQAESKTLDWWAANLPAMPLPPKRVQGARGEWVQQPGQLPPETVRKISHGGANGEKHYTLVKVAVSAFKSECAYDEVRNLVEACAQASGVDVNDPSQSRHIDSVCEWAEKNH